MLLRHKSDLLNILFGVVVLVMVVVSTSACGSAATASPTPATIPDTGGGQNQSITLDNNGQTVQLNVGDLFLLKLGEGYDWEVISSDTAVLSREPNVMVVRGAQGIYIANQAGTADLTATGTPQCQPDTACPSLAIGFSLHVVVNG